MTDFIDFNTLFAIWTGSAVPIIITFLGYYLVRRSEDRRHVFEEKKRTYSELSWTSRKVAQTLNDLRVVQLLKTDKTDEKELRALWIKLASLNSIWLVEGAVDFLRYLWEIENEENGEPKPTKVEMRQGFESIKERMTIELQAHLAQNANSMSRHSTELQRFKLTKPIQDSLGAVWQLFAEMAQNTAAGSLLTLSGLSALDTGAEFGPWTEKMQKAIADLNKALNDDLVSNK